MKKSKFVLVALLMLFGITTALADSNAHRKNKCRNDKKFYKANAKIKGGSKNCGNGSVGFNWTCNANVNGQANLVKIVRRHDPSKGACTCGDDFNPNMALAAAADAQSNATVLFATHIVYEFGCKFPNKWKAGTSSNYQSSPLNFPMVINNVKSADDNFEMGSSVQCTENIFDYANNTVNLTNFKAELRKKTPDMINDFTTFMVQISIVTGEDASGEEIENIIYSCKATAFNNDLIVEDPSGNFTSSDFTTQAFNGTGKSFKSNIASKLISLGTDITPDMEINVSFYTDCGNYEDGSLGRMAPDANLITKSIEEAEAAQTVVLKVNQNPVVENLVMTLAVKDISSDYTQKMIIKDLEGKIVSQFDLQLGKSEKTYSVPLPMLGNGVYFLYMEYGSKLYGKKIIIDRQ